MPKVLTLAGLSVLALVLVLGMAVPALAAPEAPSLVGDFEDELLRGEVISLGDQEFTILSEEEELAIAVDENTLYYQMPGPRVLVQQRLQLRQQNQLELRAQAECGQCWVLKKRVRAATASCHQISLQNRIVQVSRANLLGPLCFMCPRFLGGRAEFGDIAVGDSVVVLVDENSLAQKVLIIKPTA